MKQLILICYVFMTMTNANNMANAGYDYAHSTIKLGTPHLVYDPVSTFAATKSAIQHYYTQDSYGQYLYGYSEPLSTKQETRTADGITRGTYSYLDAAGKLQTVDYKADAAGFHVTATNLPNAELKPITETPEVAALRAQHLAAHEQLKLQLTTTTTNGNPSQRQSSFVTDTPEVAAAKVEFFKLYEAEQLRHQFLREQATQHKSTNTKQVQVASKPIIIRTSTLPVYQPPAAILPANRFAYNYRIDAHAPNGVYLHLPVS